MSGKLFGRATIRANGQVYKTSGGSTLELGGVTRTPRPGDHNADGFTEEDTPAKVEFGVQMREEVSLAEIHAIVDGTITFECDTGQTYLVNHAYSATPPMLGGDGVAKCVFQGPPAEEIL
ncbi:MAG: hypothetical protein GC145_18565 [Caulobacter sp.]|nr:hypothetical protein [Caulobacter sp.]